jgi:hypothetical protein
MMSSLNKFSYNTNLFTPEPPPSNEPLQVKKLFCGRAKELKRAYETLKANMDSRGTRKQKRPWVIHGESRSGKSHLARRVLCEFRNHPRKLKLVIEARERLQAFNVFNQLFYQLRAEFYNRTQDVTKHRSRDDEQYIHVINQFLDRVASLLEDNVTQVEVTQQNTSSIGFSVGLPAKFLSLSAKFGLNRQVTIGEKITLARPSALELADCCGVIVEALSNLKLLSHLLLMLDDIDLIEGYKDNSHNGRNQRSILTDAVILLHNTPRVDVLLTARSWYAEAHKQLQTLVDLNHSEELTPQELVTIHNKRYEVYETRKNYRSPFLTEQALVEIATDSRSLPGVFLQHLNTAFEDYKGEDGDQARDYDWFIELFRKRFERYMDLCSPATDAILQAVRNERFSITVMESNPFHNTELENQFLFQSYSSESSYFMSGIVRKVVQPLLTKQSLLLHGSTHE